MRERILLYGGPGSGKTRAWLTLAKKFSTSTFYVIDTEMGAERSLEEFPTVKNAKIYPAIDWVDYRKAQKEICGKATSIDWLVLDMADKPWNSVQRDFIENIFEQEMGDYFLEARKKIKKDTKSLFGGKDSVLRGWTDWPVINKRYEDFMFPLVYRSPANLFIASSASAVSEEDEKEVKELYGPYGIKPAGQKALAHQPDTVILTSYTRDGWLMTTVKDRGGREYMKRKPIVSFAIQYGLIAKWK